MVEENDKHLVEAVLRGRTEAFNLLVWRWQQPLHNFLFRMTGDRERARDISQDTFLRAYTRLKDLREKNKFGSWLFRIALNVHYSAYRSDQAEPAARVSALAPRDELEGQQTESQDLQLTVRTLLSRLPAEQREVVVLKVYHGFLFHEIAEIVNCPISTVKSRFYKAFEQLRADLEGRNPTA